MIQPDPGVVDEDVEPPEALRGLPDEGRGLPSRSTCASTKATWPPLAAISAATRLPRSTSRSANATFAPSITNRRTVASPIPEAPPLTAATFPFSRAMLDASLGRNYTAGERPEHSDDRIALMSMKIVPTGAALGAEIAGVDLARPIDDATFAAIERAYDEYGVIFFREPAITPAQQVAFTRRFGEIEFNIFGERWSVPGSPEIVVVSNITEDGKPIGIRRAGENWHSDMCYTARPPRGTILLRDRDPGACTGCRSATPNSPAPPRRGMPCPTS